MKAGLGLFIGCQCGTKQLFKCNEVQSRTRITRLEQSTIADLFPLLIGGKKDCVVDLEHRKCDYGVNGVEKIPCSHAIAAGSYAGLHISTLVCPVYSKDTLFAGYSENIYPCARQQVEARRCFPPEVKRGLGRQKKSRWQSWLELSRMRGRTPRKQHIVYRCLVCKETGHTRPHCKN
ncbi:hypothetical protein DY000_02053597 [Brassica cretica]|uniref:SWIM-type domain-containing protein n=1 Tax=Brassica cretica TaxID=69181 RepID=A0ABQ7A9N0_BRACR|nr:hypothetical protein DY000_02053597 [Brassica cretica]